jgi:hypothetical protein
VSPSAGITPTPKFTGTTATSGFNEFGNNTGALDVTQDATADPILDAWVGTDSPPTTTNLSDADAASGTDEINVPVAQVPLALPLSLPLLVTLNSSGMVDITNKVLSELYSGTIPGSSPYGENTWGAFLQATGLTPITSGSPTATQFLDTGSSSAKTGGYTPISVEVRKNGAGATLNFKYYLFLLDSSAYLNAGPWAEPEVLNDANAYGTHEWPTKADILPATTGNTTDTAEALAVWNTPATVGYTTAGDAATQGFKDTPVTGGDSQQVIYGLLQNNGVSIHPTYANPELAGGGGNLYTGEVNINNGTPTDPESWTVPSNLLTGSWNGTEASDPDIASASSTAYPLASVLYALSWEKFTVSKLEAVYPSGEAAATGTAVSKLLTFATTASTGQKDINTTDYYAELPSNILPYAVSAAEDVG